MERDLKEYAALYRTAEAFMGDDEFGTFCIGYTAGAISAAIVALGLDKDELVRATGELTLNDLNNMGKRAVALYDMFLGGKRYTAMEAMEDPRRQALRSTALGQLAEMARSKR